MLLQGCASVAKEIKVEMADKIEIGKSTKEDVLAILGLPHKREVKDFRGEEHRELVEMLKIENKMIEFWVYFKDAGKSSIYMPIGAILSPAIGGKSFGSSSGTSFTNISPAGPVTVYFSEISLPEKENIAAIIIFNEHSTVMDVKKGGELQ